MRFEFALPVAVLIGLGTGAAADEAPPAATQQAVPTQTIDEVVAIEPLEAGLYPGAQALDKLRQADAAVARAYAYDCGESRQDHLAQVNPRPACAHW